MTLANARFWHERGLGECPLPQVMKAKRTSVIAWRSVAIYEYAP